MGESVCDDGIWRLVRVRWIMDVSSLDWMKGSRACMPFCVCVFSMWPTTAAEHLLLAVWTHLARLTSPNPHPPTHEQWHVLPVGWLKGPCVALELSLGFEPMKSLTWARVKPRLPSRQNLDMSVVWPHKAGGNSKVRVGSYSLLLLVIKSRATESSQTNLWFPSPTWFWFMLLAVPELWHRDGHWMERSSFPVWSYRKEHVKQERVKASLMLSFQNIFAERLSCICRCSSFTYCKKWQK